LACARARTAASHTRGVHFVPIFGISQKFFLGLFLLVLISFPSAVSHGDGAVRFFTFRGTRGDTGGVGCDCPVLHGGRDAADQPLSDGVGVEQRGGPGLGRHAAVSEPPVIDSKNRALGGFPARFGYTRRVAQ